MRHAIPLILLAAAVLPARAQSRAEFSAGAGIAAVSASDGGGSQVGPAVNVALSMPVGGVRVGLEAALLAMGDEEPRTSDLRPRQTGSPGSHSDATESGLRPSIAISAFGSPSPVMDAAR